MIATTPAELRAEADRLEADYLAKKRGKVFIMEVTGAAIAHDGTRYSEMEYLYTREASEAEVQALCTIPEFAANLKRIRGEA